MTIRISAMATATLLLTTMPAAAQFPCNVAGVLRDGDCTAALACSDQVLDQWRAEGAALSARPRLPENDEADLAAYFASLTESERTYEQAQLTLLREAITTWCAGQGG